CRFATSAATWVRHWIGRAIEEQSRLIRIPSRWQYGALRVPAEGGCDGRACGAWGAALPDQPFSLDYRAEGGGGRLGDLVPAPRARGGEASGAGPSRADCRRAKVRRERSSFEDPRYACGAYIAAPSGRAADMSRGGVGHVSHRVRHTELPSCVDARGRRRNL